MKKCCANCAWYCHGDGQCYKPDMLLPALTWRDDCCGKWSFDGMDDREREDLDALVTMDERL